MNKTPEKKFGIPGSLARRKGTGPAGLPGEPIVTLQTKITIAAPPKQSTFSNTYPRF